MKKYIFCLVFIFLAVKSYQQDTMLNIKTKNKVENAIKQSFFNYRRNTVPDAFKDSIVIYKKDSNFPYKKIYTAFFDVKPYRNSLKSLGLENFYLAKKENELIQKNNSFERDSNCLNRYLKYYPFSDEYLIFYDTLTNEGPRVLSGQGELSYFLRSANNKYTFFFRPENIILLRLFSFGVTTPEQIHLLYRDSRFNFDWIYVDSCQLSFGYPAIVKIPIQNPHPLPDTRFDGIEVIFYTDTIPSITSSNSMTNEERLLDTKRNITDYEMPATMPFPFEKKKLYEVKYIIRNQPKSYEESLIPNFRKLPESEKEKLVSILAGEKKLLQQFFIDSKTLYEKMSPYHLLPKQ